MSERPLFALATHVLPSKRLQQANAMQASEYESSLYMCEMKQDKAGSCSYFLIYSLDGSPAVRAEFRGFETANASGALVLFVTASETKVDHFAEDHSTGQRHDHDVCRRDVSRTKMSQDSRVERMQVFRMMMVPMEYVLSVTEGESTTDVSKQDKSANSIESNSLCFRDD